MPRLGTGGLLPVLLLRRLRLKALGTGLTTGMRWQDVEIRANTVGKPEIVLHGEVQRYAHEHNISAMYVSMSHTNAYAVAQVTLCSV